MQLTLSAAAPTLARVIGICTTDPRVAQYANEAEARLMPRGKWVGTVQGVRMCLTNQNCVTWPRRVQTVETYSLCKRPGTIENQWYEYLPSGPGVLDAESCVGNRLIDRGGSYCCFQDIAPSGKRIRVQASVAEAADARILLLGFDDNGQWIRTQDAGEWIDGEYVAISTTMQQTVNNFSYLSRVIKPVTNGVVRGWDYNPVTGLIIPIFVYEPDETLPDYRRSLIPGLMASGGCCNQSDCESKNMQAMVKLKHIPVSKPNDFFTIGNVGALKLMVQAILKEEKNLFAEARAYESQAIAVLDQELASHLGDGMIQRVRYEHTDTWGAGGWINYW